MKSLNITYYAPSINHALHRKYKHNNKDMEIVTAPPVPYYLHGYFRKHYPEYESYIKWKPTIIYNYSEDELLEKMREQDTDILCASLYVWNDQKILKVLKNIKNRYHKPVTIVLGGPSCNADKEDWHVLYPYVDHFIVGQGEKAWSSLLLDILGVKPIQETEKNIIHILKKGDTVPEKKFEYEFIRGIHYSPYLECKDMVIELIETYKNESFEFVWVYETQRGCPYNCSFCDWNGGRTNKTQKRKEINFIDEIDFFAENGMYNMHLADANWGMWDVDVDITRRLVYHNLNTDGKFKIIGLNLSKNVTNNYKEILDIVVKHNLTKFLKISTQDIHQDVLDAIHRPENYEEKKRVMIETLKRNNSKQIPGVEVILGLPQQTVESWIQTLDEVYSSGFNIRVYHHNVLNNAPMSLNSDYVKDWGVVVKTIYDTYDMMPTGETVEEIPSIESNIYYPQVVQTNSFTEEDFVRMVSMHLLYKRLLYNYTDQQFTNTIIVPNWKWLKEILVYLSQTDDFNYIVEKRYENLKKYSVMALNSSEGKLIRFGEEFGSLISRHRETINDIIDSHQPSDTTVVVSYLKFWDNFDYMKNWLNR